MERYIKIDSTEKLKAELIKICKVNSQAKLRAYLDLSGSTISRILSSEKEHKNGPKIQTVESVVKVIIDYYKEDDAMKIREDIYSLLYDPEDAEKKMNVYRESHSEATAVIMALEKDPVLKNIYNVMEEMIKDSLFDIENRKISTRTEKGILFSVTKKPKTIPLEADMHTMYGIYLTEENFCETIREVEELNTADGVIILFCGDVTVFDNACRENILRVENNILLYCLSEKRKVRVKSIRKHQKKFLKNIFGKDNLVFLK